MWIYILVLIILYLVSKKNVLKWLKVNKETIKKWKDNVEIMEAYGRLKVAFDAADFDKKWNILEILTVLGLVIALLKKIKKYEEEEVE